jgi:BCD family chlorophyll transporter-like MFS transporter
MASYGVMIGIPAFMAVIAAAPYQAAEYFALGTFLIGFGAGLFGHGTLTATMNRAPQDQIGLALGAWGASQALAAGLAIAFGGILRDLVALMPASGRYGPAFSYMSVYTVEILLLAFTLALMLPLLRKAVPLSEPIPSNVPAQITAPSA